MGGLYAGFSACRQILRRQMIRHRIRFVSDHPDRIAGGSLTNFLRLRIALSVGVYWILRHDKNPRRCDASTAWETAYGVNFEHIFRDFHVESYAICTKIF
jgi:hypothetical protein